MAGHWIGTRSGAASPACIKFAFAALIRMPIRSRLAMFGASLIYRVHCMVLIHPTWCQLYR